MYRGEEMERGEGWGRRECLRSGSVNISATFFQSILLMRTRMMCGLRDRHEAKVVWANGHVGSDPEEWFACTPEESRKDQGAGTIIAKSHRKREDLRKTRRRFGGRKILRTLIALSKLMFLVHIEVWDVEACGLEIEA
jgi:hypothetical protein